MSKIKNIMNTLWERIMMVIAVLFFVLFVISLVITGNDINAIINCVGMFSCMILDKLVAIYDKIK